jgi:integrase
MHALDILQALVARGAIPKGRAKDIKTALNKLADACQLPIGELDLSSLEPTYQDTLRAFFARLDPPASQHTERNTLQNLAQLYRQAHAGSLLLPPVRPAPRGPRPYARDVVAEMRRSSPYFAHRSGKARVRYGAPPSQWPDEIVQGWETYAAMKAIRVRQITLRAHRKIFVSYMGYNLWHDPIPVTRWDQLFEPARILRCVAWLAARVGVERISQRGMGVVIVLIDIAKHLERPDLATLKKLERELPKPSKVYDKKLPRHTVSLVELDRLGVTLIQESRRPWPGSHESTGGRRASKFATGLIIRLLARCPRRAREVIEMDLGERLYQDHRGIWQIHYRSHQLKIAVHDGQPNEFRMPWPADLVDDLNEYLRDYRPRLLKGSNSTVVFPAMGGRKLEPSSFGHRITFACYDRLKKHVYPHLFRTLWCDAYLDANPGDWEGAAAMLNDTPQTVQGWYRQFRVEQQLKKAVNFNAQLFGNGKRTSR